VNFAEPSPKRKAAIAVFVCVVLAIFLFLSLIAHYEPVCNDGWWHLYRMKKKANDQPGLSFLFFKTAKNYMETNPRIGQTFTDLSYWPYHFHEFLTPSVILLVFLSIFILALGRMPNPANLHDSYLIVMVMALCWLSIPEVGIAYFYRPVAGNYVFGACVQLLFFIPLRLWVDDPENFLPKVSFSLFMFFGGVLAGMANEHTGPMAILAFAVIAVFTARRRECRLPVWTVAGWVGLVSGYFALFFAPGQTKRYSGLATKTTLVENITARGWGGNLGIVGDFMMMLMPLMAVMAVMTCLYFFNGHRRSSDRDIGGLRGRFLNIGFLVACALGIVMTTLASPLVEPRLYIAPVVLLIIAGVIFTDIVSRPKKLARLFCIGAMVVNLGFMARVYVVYSTVNREFLERMEILGNAKRGSVVRVPLYSYTKRTRVFFGDDFTRESRRRWAAKYFRLERIDIYPRPESHPDS